MLSPDQIIKDRMYDNDPFSKWLGISIMDLDPGKVTLQMTIRPEMCNGFGIAHGGITYSLADSALAFASNAHGIQSVSIETSINHIKPLQSGDIITAVCSEQSLSRKTGIYLVEVNCEGVLVALFKGTVYRTGKEWE